MTTRKRSRSKREGGSGPHLYPYQLRWVQDDARFKIACKARQIGFSFAAAWRVVDVRLERPGLTVWLSASERQAREAMEHVRRFCRELGAVAIFEEEFIEGTLVKQQQVRFPNGSRIVALPANPDTVRGFAGDVVLDEFAFHRDAEAIWRAAFATATRGYQIEIISTPNSARGKYYELARAAGLVDYVPPAIEHRGETQPGFPHAPSDVAHSRNEFSAGLKAGPDEKTTARAARLEEYTSVSLGGGARKRSRDSASFAGGGHGFSRADKKCAGGASLEGAGGNPGRVSPPRGGSPPFVSAQGKQGAPLQITGHEPPVTGHGPWSPHWVSLAHARAEGFVVDVESLRAAISDEDAWQQEYCCRFLTQAAHFIPPEMVVAAEHPAATTSLLWAAVSPQPSAFSQTDRALRGTQPLLGQGGASAPPTTMARAAQPWKGFGETLVGFPQAFPLNACFLGVDIGRRRDLTVLWLLEIENPAAPADARRYLTRAVQTLERRPFAEQRRAIDSLLVLRTSAAALAGHGLSRAENTAPLGATAEGARGNPAWVSPAGVSLLVLRCAIDASGLGLMLAEELQSRWGARVEPVTFTAAVKEDLAVRVKRLLEERRLLLPYDPVIRASLAAVKRFVTPTGAVRFDADRTDAGHADHFWALALALAAADDSAPATDFISTHSARAFAQTSLF